MDAERHPPAVAGALTQAGVSCLCAALAGQLGPGRQSCGGSICQQGCCRAGPAHVPAVRGDAMWSHTLQSFSLAPLALTTCAAPSSGDVAAHVACQLF